MKKSFILLLAMGWYSQVSGQTGHIMQGVGAVNMSMGGAATAQPADINGALQWNPAALSVFNKKILAVNAGVFFSAPELSSTAPVPPSGQVTGTTKDDRGISILPAAAMVWGKKDSRHTFGVSAFGISGFGVTFPQNNGNPINAPQNMGGFGKIQSDYQLLQVGFSYAYKVNDKFSIGFTPYLNYSQLELAPNPLASPDPTKGYPVSDDASALGFGAQAGLFFQPGGGLKLGVAYKTQQYFSEFNFENKYLDGSTAPEVKFRMNYPAILSLGVGYSIDNKLDLALDYRWVNYKNTKGFAAKGWTNTFSVAGFGWEDISIVSAGLQYKGFKKFPVRLGYTHSTNPINSQLAMFSVPATAIIKNAYQAGFGYEFSPRFTLNLTYHHGTSSGSTSGPLLSPMMIGPANPYGAIPGSDVSYKMTTDLIMVGIQYNLN